MNSNLKPNLQKINKPITRHGKNALFAKGGDTMATKMNPGFMAMMAKKKEAAFEKSGKDVEKKGMREGSKADMALDAKQGGMKKGGCTKMAKGGFARAADGVAKKGKTQATQIKMKRGGSCK